MLVPGGEALNRGAQVVVRHHVVDEDGVSILVGLRLLVVAIHEGYLVH